MKLDEYHHKADRRRRPGKKSSSHRPSTKPASRRRPLYQEPYPLPQDVDASYPDSIPTLSSDPSLIHSGRWAPWNDPSCIGASIPLYPGPKVRLDLKPHLDPSWGLRTFETLQIGDDAKANSTTTDTPPSVYRPLPETKYTAAHVLILTWDFHDLTGAYDVKVGDYVPGLSEETKRLETTFGRCGYQVHKHKIPMDGPNAKLKTTVRNFLAYANDHTLLIVYYHGHGGLGDDGNLVFSSHEHSTNTALCQIAAAELYKAMVSMTGLASTARTKMAETMASKYARFQPIAEAKWEDIRSMILRAPCDLLLVLDCCAAGGANLRHVDWQPGRKVESYAKHLYAACGFESSTRGDMTAAMCEVLDDYVERGSGTFLSTRRLHQIVEDRVQRKSVGSQPIFKQLLPMEADQSILLPLFHPQGKGARV